MGAMQCVRAFRLNQLDDVKTYGCRHSDVSLTELDGGSAKEDERAVLLDINLPLGASKTTTPSVKSQLFKYYVVLVHCVVVEEICRTTMNRGWLVQIAVWPDRGRNFSISLGLASKSCCYWLVAP